MLVCFFLEIYSSLLQLKYELLSNIPSLQVEIEFSLGQWETLFFKVQQSLHFWGCVSLEEKHCHSEVNSAHPLGKHIHTNGSTVNQWQRPTGKRTCFTVHWSCNLISIILNETFFTSSVTSLFTASQSVHHKTVLQILLKEQPCLLQVEVHSRASTSFSHMLLSACKWAPIILWYPEGVIIVISLLTLRCCCSL